MAEKRKFTLFMCEKKPFLTEGRRTRQGQVALLRWRSKMLVKVVMVKMVIFVSDYVILLTIYKYKYLYYSGGF